MRKGYFSDFTWSKFFLYLAAALYVLGVGFISLLEPFMEFPCEEEQSSQGEGGDGKKFPNPSFPNIVCLDKRHLILLGFSRSECGFARRLIGSVILGGLIGWERRQADRPAGIRTMSLVSLGSCLFTINSSFAFLNGPMSWDASRVAAAIPSGVGFLGAGLIFKKEEKGHDGDSNHVVHGLTTAASVWLSAAVGIACGGDLFMAASFCVAIMLLLLRFGPRQHEHVDDGDYGDLGEEDNNDVIFDDKGLRRTELTRLTSSTSHAVGDLLAAASTSEILLPRIESSTDLDDPESVPNYASIHSHQHNDESMSLRSSTWGESGRAMTSSRRGSTTTQKRRKNQAALGSIV